MNQQKQQSKGRKDGKKNTKSSLALSRKASQGGSKLGDFAPIASSHKQTTSEPVIKQVKGGTVIRHRELVTTVLGSVAFTATRYPLNPGISLTFPWLSTQASLWEQYHFRKLRFEYITRTATTTLGSVLLVPDYDPDDPSPATEAIASTSEGTVEDACWKNLTCILDPSALNPFGGLMGRRFVRSFNVAGDLSTYDSGNMFLCTVEEAGVSAIGKLWVDYEVCLYKPQLSPSTASPSRMSSLTRAVAQTIATGVTSNLIFTAIQYDPLSVATVAGPLTTGVFTPPKGSYLLTLMTYPQDSASEVFEATVAIQKNGVSIVGAQQAAISPATGTFERFQIALQALVAATGTDTFNMTCVMTGAAGTLSVPFSLIWQLA